MQSIMFLRATEDGPVERLINLDQLSTASPSSENPEWTRAICGLSDTTIHMPFAEFVKQVEHLIAENYRISTETSAQWHAKRMADSEKMMKEVLVEALNK